MKVGIICSVKLEVDLFREELGKFHTVELEKNEYTLSKLGGEEIVLVYPHDNTRESSQECAEQLINHFEVKRLISIGFAGAIDYTLAPLAVVIGKTHLNHLTGKIYEANSEMMTMLEKIYPSAVICDMVTYEYFLEDVEEKKELKRKFPDISAIDMESAYLAEVAQRHNIPFISLRAITDNANDQAVRNYKKYELLASGKTVDILFELIKSKHFG
jgi:adenosylhomocysteine nucleosidase